MTISSFYTVFVTADMNKMTARFARTGSLKMLHHFETDEFDYYVMVDNSGNNTDFIQFKHKAVEDSFFAVRINTDDYDKMAAILSENGFSLGDAAADTEKVKLGLFISKNHEPSILLFTHKK